MTSQEKKAELLKYRMAEAEIVRLEQEIMRWRSKAERTTTVLKMVPGGSDGTRNIETATEVIETLAAELTKRQVDLIEMRKTIGSAIEAVDDEKLRQVLRLKYIDGRTWENVAECMGITPRGATKMHGRALSKIKLSSL